MLYLKGIISVKKSIGDVDCGYHFKKPQKWVKWAKQKWAKRSPVTCYKNLKTADMVLGYLYNAAEANLEDQTSIIDHDFE